MSENQELTEEQVITKLEDYGYSYKFSLTATATARTRGEWKSLTGPVVTYDTQTRTYGWEHA